MKLIAFVVIFLMLPSACVTMANGIAPGMNETLAFFWSRIVPVAITVVVGFIIFIKFFLPK